MTFAAIATTPTAAQTLIPFCVATATPLWLPSALVPEAEPWRATGVEIRGYGGPLRATVADLWPAVEGFVFGLATGAVVRLIAPLLADKATDPAVVVVDEAGQFAISLCGGHQGGGDRLAQVVSQTLSATLVITGSAHHRGIVGVDVLGTPFGWVKGSGDWTGVASEIARSQPIQVIQEAGSTLWWEALPPDHGWQQGWADPTNPTEARPQAAARVWISPIQRQFSPTAEIPKVQWHPRVLWVGVGCERGTSAALIEQAIATVCDAHHLAMAAIAGIATLDLKADEAGLLAVCEARGWPLRCFAPEVLRTIAVPNPSPVVEQAVGTPSVAEAAAIAAACNPMNLQTPPTTDELPILRVTKHVWRQPDQPGAVTIAIAQAEQEFTDHSGHLWLVGTGPGRLDQITPAVKAAIAQADAVVGYQLYVDLIRPLLRSGQIVEAMPITQEQQRADRAIALAQQGLSVAVISSGDCGIYAMAGLVFETLAAQDWPGHSPTVEVLPGISALQAAASRVGAPLMHDFCAISLSDLLTPWPVIEKRLQAAATADFVVAIYNPKSQKRTEQIAIAQRIFAHHRPPETPVAIVRAAYRPDEHITLTTVQDLLAHPIDMLSTVLIGNSSTRLHAGYVLTPRGYPVSGA